MRKLLPLLLILLALCVAACAAAEMPTPVPESAAPVPEATPEPMRDVTDPPETEDPGEEAEEAVRPGWALEMPLGDEYMKKDFGVTTFRGNAFRQNAASGHVSRGTDRMELLWDRIVYQLGENDHQFPWPGQALIVKWSVQVREKIDFTMSYEPKTGMKEVIVAEKNGRIYFFDLQTGELTRHPLSTGYELRSTLATHTNGMPYLFVGQAGGDGEVGLRIFNLYDLSEMDMINGLDGKLGGLACGNGAFLSAPLLDRNTDALVTAGTNGFLYKIQLRSNFDYEEGKLSYDPQVDAAKKKSAELSPDDPRTGYEAPVAALYSYIYCADMDGKLRCVESESMQSIWEKDLEDAVLSSPAISVDSGRLTLYAANTLTNREEGKAAVYCLNALTGKEYWRREFGVKPDNELPLDSVGFVASPVVGKNSLNGLVYYTVTGLTRAERKALGLKGVQNSALIALWRDTGATVWIHGMDDYCYSSPVAVYDEDGNGWIIQCASDGYIFLLDGREGNVIGRMRVDGVIDASPAVYRDIMVIPASSDIQSHVYAIRLYSSAEEAMKETTPVPSPEKETPTALPPELIVYETFIPFETSYGNGG